MKKESESLGLVIAFVCGAVVAALAWALYLGKNP